MLQKTDTKRCKEQNGGLLEVARSSIFAFQDTSCQQQSNLYHVLIILDTDFTTLHADSNDMGKALQAHPLDVGIKQSLRSLSNTFNHVATRNNLAVRRVSKF
jgi:hypothetical protein